MPIKFFNSKKTLNEAAIEFDGLIEITDEIRNQIQQTLLEMYDDLKEMCDANGITLYLGGGTAIGALRHQGFIPWDDDLDLNISRKDYKKLKELFGHSKLNENYILNAPNYSDYPKARFPQMIKRGTLFEEINDISRDKDLKGIKIDILIVDSVPDNKLARTLRGLRCNALEFIAARVQGVEGSDEIYRELLSRAGKGIYYFYNMIGKLFSVIPATKWFNRIDKVVNVKNPKSQYCTIATGRGHYFGEMLPREVFYPATEVEFCGRKAAVFHDPDKYLKNLYGDYMTIPPEEKRERHFIKAIDFGEDTIR